MSELSIIRNPNEMQSIALSEKAGGRSIAVVPTMGALHEGHRQLIEKGRELADVLIVTIFVNPTQFAPNEDLGQYPRTFDADKVLCENEGVDYIFFPRDGEMYPEGYASWVEVEGLGAGLCGRSRPSHFRGVTTVCTKLFLITQADRAVFGWKDAQQQIIIRRMVRDLNIPVEIVGVDTVRESDGLALSSRNAYLSESERAQAPVLYHALQAARKAATEDGVTVTAELVQMVKEKICEESDGEVDYVECADMRTLQSAERFEAGHTLLALAVFFGKTRLIDNIRF